MRFFGQLMMGLVLSGATAAATAQTVDELPRSRGALLYENHCGSCHNQQLHWREKRLAKDWASLADQVRRWQQNAGLGWSGEEIGAVAEFLNQRFYRYLR